MVLQERIELSTSPLPIKRFLYIIDIKSMRYKSSIVFCSIPIAQVWVDEQFQWFELIFLLSVRM